MRFAFQSVAKDGQGRIIPSMTVSVYRANGTIAANVYTALTGGSPVTSVTTSSDGSFAFYVSDSDFSLNQKFKITLTKTDFATKSYDNITIFAPVPTAIFYVDANETDQGAVGNGYSLKDIIDAAGSNNVTIKFRNSSGSATTSYTLTTSETIPSTCAIEPEQGAMIVQGGTATLTISGIPVGNPMHQWLSGFTAGDVTFGAGNLPNVLQDVWMGIRTLSQIESAPYLSAGINWTIRTSAANNDWFGVCYGNGLFVAVGTTGTGNRIMTSPDGINWIIRTSPEDNNWRAVTYGNGLFVAIASSGTYRVMTSSNGIDWTGRTASVANQWHGICYGNGLFVATAYSGTGDRVMTSPDGITWTTRVSAADNSWRAVTYGNGLFVAVAHTGAGNRVMTSPDGITWTIRTTPSYEWLGICYGNGLFVATAINEIDIGGSLMTSPDGITWTLRTAPDDIGWYSVVYGGGLFVAVAGYLMDGFNVMTSHDGINWAKRATPADNCWHFVTYGNGMFVAVAFTGSGNRVMTSGIKNMEEIPHNNIYQGGIIVRGNLESTIIQHEGDTDTYIAFGNDNVSEVIGGITFLKIIEDGTQDTVVYNEDGVDIDFRIEGVGEENALTVEGSSGNVGVGTATPNAKAVLDITSTTKGLLFPRMTTTQRDNITTPPAGLIIYNNTTNKLNFYNGTGWEVVTSV